MYLLYEENIVLLLGNLLFLIKVYDGMCIFLKIFLDSLNKVEIDFLVYILFF